MTKQEKMFAHRFFRIMREIEANRRRTFRKNVGMSEKEYYDMQKVTPDSRIIKPLAYEHIKFQS